MRSLPLASLASLTSLVLASACTVAGTAGPEDRFGDIDFSSGKGDGTGPNLIDVTLGESLSDLELHPGPQGEGTFDEFAAAVHGFRLDLAPGQSVAVAMRAADAAGAPLDAYLMLYDANSDRLASSDNQALLPEGLSSDAVISFTATEGGFYYLLAAAGEDLTSEGRYRIDFVALDSDPGVDLGFAGPEVSAFRNELSTYQASVEHFVATGAWAEGANGFLSMNEEAWAQLPLSERSQSRAEIDFVNEARGLLFDGLVDAGYGGNVDTAGAAAAKVWAQTR